MDERTDRSETLLLALTRPEVILGVPLFGFMINGGVWLFAGMLLSGPHWYRAPMLYWLMTVPCHFIMQRIVAWDFHGFRTLALWLQTTAIGWNAIESVSIRPDRSGKDFPSSV